ncbi:MAG TPA: DUF4139 domain-containing protein [Polyangiaceae bacterium]
MRWSLGVSCLALAAGCARGPNISTRELPLRRVVVYRNGVGYFERAGKVDEEQVTFKMRQRMVGDFLATLAIVERGGSSLRAASFPLEVAKNDPDAPDPRFIRMLESWQTPDQLPGPKPPPEDKLREVVLRLDGKEHELAIGYVSTTPVWRPSYRVVVQDGGADLQAWGIVQNLSGEDWKDVELSLVAGAPLAFESTLGEPVTPARPIVTDTGEVIAAVPESMTSLQEKQGELDRVAPAEAPAPAAPPPPPSIAQVSINGNDADEDEKRDIQPMMKSMGRGGAAGRNAPKKRAEPARAVAPYAPAGNAAPMAQGVSSELQNSIRSGLSAPRRMSALAAVAVEAGATHYDIPTRVTLPDQSATMVLLINQRVPGEAVFLFSPDGGVPDSATHPFRVVRFTNATNGLFERGPIAVFEKGAFLGQGMLDPLPPKATATVPFALERSLAVESARDYQEQGARLFKIESGALTIERDSVTKTTYTSKNGSDDNAKLLIRHPRQAGARLFKPPPETEDNLGTGSALIPIQVRAHARTELVVDERRPNQQSTDWLSQLAEDAVKAYLADPRADHTIAGQLSNAWSLRDTLKKSIDEQQGLLNEQAELEKETRETRLSLEAIEKNNQAADLRQKLTRRLAEVTTRMDQITKRLVELGLTINERRVRFQDAIRVIKLLTPLPPKD